MAYSEPQRRVICKCERHGATLQIILRLVSASVLCCALYRDILFSSRGETAYNIPVLSGGQQDKMRGTYPSPLASLNCFWEQTQIWANVLKA